MKKVEIRGIIPPVITPMNENETTNEREPRSQVNRQINGGVHGLFPFEINGEGYILSEAEKEQVLSIIIDETKGRVPVYAGTEYISVRDIICQSGMARSLGTDTLSITTPSFAVASQNELYEYYKAVAEAMDVPIVPYNIPIRTGNSPAPATIVRLSKTESIVRAEDSPENFDDMLQYIGQTYESGDFTVLSGSDSPILWDLLAGGTGDIAGRTNVSPEVMVSIHDSFVAGNLEGARKAQDSVRSFRTCFKYGNPNIIVKTAVALLGYPAGKCRAPFNQVPEEGVKVLKRVLAENHEKGMCWWRWRNV